MSVDPQERHNVTVWDGDSPGHYEVYYFKLNDLEEEVAFWVRFTVRSRVAGGGEPVVDVWAIFFDHADPGRNDAWKATFPVRDAQFEREPFGISVGGCELGHLHSKGGLGDEGRRFEWDLRIVEPAQRAFKHFPHDRMYRLPFPKTKVLAPHLSCRYSGRVRVGEREFELESVPGHQAHHWGSAYAARWTWANCSAFKEDPDAVFEALTAKIALGPFESPYLTIFYLRAFGRDYLFNSLPRWISNRSDHGLEHWTLEAEQDGVLVVCRITPSSEHMVGVTYTDPAGAQRVCHNTKVADMQATVYGRRGGAWRKEASLGCEGGVAFELVQPEHDPRVELKL